MAESGKIVLQVLILPKFEKGSMSGDAIGEAQLFYEQYFVDAESYEIPGGYLHEKLYVRDGLGLYVTGCGKINASASLHSILMDPRFDCSETYILSVGCAGGSYEETVLGDVILASSTVDYDIGHHADFREVCPDLQHCTDQEMRMKSTWYCEADFFDQASCRMNPVLLQKVYALLQDLRLEESPMAVQYAQEHYGHLLHPSRRPCVMLGTTVSADNYWKGLYDHENAKRMIQVYQCPDAYKVCEMEDHAMARIAERFHLLDHFLVLRGSVNYDVFSGKDTPDSLWGESSAHSANGLEEDTDVIFDTAMKNVFLAGAKIIEAIRNHQI